MNLKRLSEDIQSYKVTNKKSGTTVITFNLKNVFHQKNFNISWPNYRPCYFVTDEVLQLAGATKLSIADFKLLKPKALIKKTLVLDTINGARLLKDSPKLFKKLYTKPLTVSAQNKTDVIQKVMHVTKVNITCKRTFSVVVCKELELLTDSLVQNIVDLICTTLMELKVEPKFTSIYLKGTQTPVTRIL